MLIGNLTIHVKNYVNKTIHICEVRAYIYDKKHNRLYWQLPEQIIRVNITLNPYKDRIFSVTVKSSILYLQVLLKSIRVFAFQRIQESKSYDIRIRSSMVLKLSLYYLVLYWIRPGTSGTLVCYRALW